MQSILSNNLPQANRLFQKHKVIRAYAFGSILSDDFNKDSDIDFIIDVDEKINPVELGEHLWNLQFELQDLFKREVDLITSRSLKNPYFKREVEQTKRLIYE
jgi:predicted nucleotidyltransferase